MKKYIDPNNDRYQYQVLNTVNGYSIEVLILSTGDIAAVTPLIAARLQVTLPNLYRVQSCTREAAEEQLEELAQLNGWQPLDER